MVQVDESYVALWGIYMLFVCGDYLYIQNLKNRLLYSGEDTPIEDAGHM